MILNLLAIIMALKNNVIIDTNLILVLILHEYNSIAAAKHMYIPK